MAFVSSAQIGALHGLSGAVRRSHHQSSVTVPEVLILHGADILRFAVRFVIGEHWEDKVVKYPLSNCEWMLLQYTENRG